MISLAGYRLLDELLSVFRKIAGAWCQNKTGIYSQSVGTDTRMQAIEYFMVVRPPDKSL